MNKTNAMRLLDAAHINYDITEYEYDEKDLSGLHAADNLGLSYYEVFKTLVCIGNDKEHYVFCIPVDMELDLKKAAKAANIKSVEMIKMKDLLPLTGYMRGGCSPIGMKKQYKTFIDENAILVEYIYISGGKRGVQIKLKPNLLNEYLGNSGFYDICK